MRIKRLFDIFFSSLGLLIFAPLLILLALWIKIDSRGTVFFRQERIGRFGLAFKIFKFRTMQLNAEQQGQLTVGNDARITRAGHFLRKTKLDEMPQLIDVLRGKMSLVGPRPEVARYVAKYPPSAREKILALRPGITDWAAICMIDENQLLGKSSDPERYYVEKILPQKLKYYLEYADRHSLLGDLQIIFATLKKIITR